MKGVSRNRFWISQEDLEVAYGVQNHGYMLQHISAPYSIYTISILFYFVVFYFVLDGLPSIEHMTPQQKIPGWRWI